MVFIVELLIIVIIIVIAGTLSLLFGSSPMMMIGGLVAKAAQTLFAISMQMTTTALDFVAGVRFGDIAARASGHSILVRLVIIHIGIILLIVGRTGRYRCRHSLFHLVAYCKRKQTNE